MESPQSATTLLLDNTFRVLAVYVATYLLICLLFTTAVKILNRSEEVKRVFIYYFGFGIPISLTGYLFANAAAAGGVEYVFIDTAGRSDDSALSAARAADLVLIPSRPNILEVETLPQVNDLLRLAGSPPAFILLNGIHPAAGRASVAELPNYYY